MAFATQEDVFNTIEPVLTELFKEFSDWNITLNPSAASGSGVTLVASESIFTSSHVGCRFSLTDDPANKYHQVEVTGYTSGPQVTVTVRETLN